MNEILSELSKFLLICSNDGKVAHATSLATFFILLSGSSVRNTYSDTTTNMSIDSSALLYLLLALFDRFDYESYPSVVVVEGCRFF